MVAKWESTEASELRLVWTVTEDPNPEGAGRALPARTSLRSAIAFGRKRSWSHPWSQSPLILRRSTVIRRP